LPTAPILAGLLPPIIDVTGIIAIDLVTLVIAFLFLLVVSVGLIAYRVRQVREVEAIVPDHDQD